MEKAIVKVSSKRQITIPAHIYRALNLYPGAKLEMQLKKNQLILSNPAKTYTDLLAGSLKGVYGNTKEEVDEYIRKERETWE
ncbi:MAG: AbrB/MazE/SpoVT family DNA-binding domain-containing protein [Peptococcaceae bacterium]|nr:AbrB/MazE/SpoVT family DNA-binding domain-containing protein [Peptococcaceae bacterium]